MNLQQKSVLKLSVAAILGVAVGNVAAIGVDLTATTKAASPFAKELPSATTSLLNGTQVAAVTTLTNPLDVKIPLVPGYSINAANPYYVKIALTGAAKFGAAPTISCAVVTTTAGSAGGDSAAGAVTVNGAGTNLVTFQIPSGYALSNTSSTGGCVFSVSALTISGLADVGISGTVEYKDGANNATLALTGPYITFKKSISAALSTNGVAGTAANATIDVTTGSKKFTAATLATTTTAMVGSVSYALAGTAVYNASGYASTGAIYISGSNGFSVTVGGPAVGNAASVFLSVTACTTANYSAAVASGTTVTLTGITSPDISAGLTVCLGFGGTTAITDGQITAVIAKNAETISQNPDFSVSSSSIYSIPKNGAVKTINFLTNPAGFATYVRFTNPTAFDGNVLVTAINDDGLAGGTVWTFPLAKGASQMYPVTYIQAQTGVATATTVPSGGLIGNKFRLVINADTSDLSVQALNVSKDGNSFGQLSDK